jgi:hypothetical protein
VFDVFSIKTQKYFNRYGFYLIFRVNKLFGSLALIARISNSGTFYLVSF